MRGWCYTTISLSIEYDRVANKRVVKIAQLFFNDKFMKIVYALLTEIKHTYTKFVGFVSGQLNSFLLKNDIFKHS